ncbi:MAG: DEAD/DEAH box helicase [Cyclobacteriaceae bacterium]|nr:DEAD/DEAH box helicase [Cyclobacteriaceae bacterium]
MLQAIAGVGFESPTEIQRKCFTLIQGGQQVIGIAQTGTGKTAAYLIPLLQKINYAQDAGPRALILVPTKELTKQVTDTAMKLAAHTDMRIISLFGGVGIKSQVEQLQQGSDIIVATPGRLLELYQEKKLTTKHVKTLVIDEADRMMDMGFIHQLRKILDILPSKRQNLLFSATFPDKVEKLSEEFLEFPHKVEVTPQATVARQVSQVYYEVPNFKTKINFLEQLLSDKGQFTRVIIFTRTKETANNIFKFIERRNFGPVRVIHSNKGQNTRMNALNDFSKGEVRVLVATDVSARGIDISKVSHVINFDVPTRHDDYVHRIGRTGRASEVGQAITMASEPELFHIGKIEKLIREKIPLRTLPAEVKIEETPFEEAQLMAKAIDNQRKRDDPNFKGAFHEKKRNKKP